MSLQDNGKVALLLGRSGRRGRTGYLLLTVAVMVGAWLLLAALASPFLRAGGDSGSDSLVVNNARNKSTPLPVKYADRIAAIPGVAAVNYTDLQMLVCAGSTVTVNAVGGPIDANELTKDGHDGQAVARWRDDPIGLLVSQSAADACGWQVGQGIEPLDVRGQSLRFHVSGIASVKDDDPRAKAHYDYVNRQHSLVAGEGRVLLFSVEALDPGDNHALAARIDAEFAQDDPPVTAYPDTAREDARARFGRVQYLVAMVMGALFLSCVLVLASVMAFAAVERRPQLGILRVLGFPRRVLVLGFVLEVIGIVVAGALLGIAFGEIALHYLPGWLQGSFLRVAPAPWAYRLLPLWLGVLALVTLVQPCLVALRAHPLDCREG